MLRDRFVVEHLDTSDHRAHRNVGRWDATNIFVALRTLRVLHKMLNGPRGVIYLPLSQSAPGFLRDSFYIRLAARRGWKVAVHLRGSDFRSFCDGSTRLIRHWIRSTMQHVTSAAVMGVSLRWVFEGVLPAERIA